MSYLSPIENIEELHQLLFDIPGETAVEVESTIALESGPTAPNVARRSPRGATDLVPPQQVSRALNEARPADSRSGSRVVRIMDFTPEDMEAVQACLDGVHGNVPVAVEPAAAALLLPHTVYRVADLLALPAWPAEQLRLVVERWQPDVEVRVERIR